MKFVDLKTGFLLTGFADFESAFAASEELSENGFKIAYLNEAGYVRACEVRSYVRNFEAADTQQFQNYHYDKNEFGKLDARDSFMTALEVYAHKVGGTPKFVMVLSYESISPFRKAKSKAKEIKY